MTADVEATGTIHGTCGHLPSKGNALAAGVVGAGSALAVGELLAGLSRRIPSLVLSVADVVIRQADADTAGAAIEVFGTNNKPALSIGIVVISLLIGGYAARASRLRPWVLMATYVVFGALGAWAAGHAPLSSAGLGAMSAVLAALAGWQATHWLLARSPTPAPGSLIRSDPGLDRRRFLTGTVGLGTTAVVTASVGRLLRSNNTV
ncbi:MAG: hypothetical protein P8N02_03315 [Actinomycetota bacterium]|nr:hypothetical protein [Actinomycetota bacterium]